MIYQPDQYYNFAVRPGNPADEYLMIEVDGPDGPAEVALKKLDFQKDPKRQQPSRIEARVVGCDEQGLPILAHAIGSYVNELYSEVYARNETFECTVTNIPTNPATEPYGVVDSYGIYYRINEPGGLLARGQRIRCKFKILSGKRYEVRRVDDQGKLPFLHPKELFEATQLSSRVSKALYHILQRQEFDTVRVDIAVGKPKWTLTAANIVRDNLNEWFVDGMKKRDGLLAKKLLEAYQRILLYLLEGSNFLNGAAPEQRRSLQHHLTEMVEAIEPYRSALRLFDEHSEDEYVKSLFDKLEKSGYLYHPASQFAVMMLVFRVNPHKVNTYLNRIFESIFMRDLDNWNREPFRSAFVEQFQIYVHQSRSEIDRLPLAETREQKTRLEAIIIALALEIILSENEDTDRTRSLFYRYISLLRPLNTEALLTKSFLALMGIATNDKLDYASLREPMMMMTKATVLDEGDHLKRLTSQYRYTNGITDIDISEKGIILSRSMDRELVNEGMIERVIPDGFLPWLHLQVKANGIKGLSGSKIRNLSDHNTWWSNIENTLFGDYINGNRRKDNELRAAQKGEKVWIVIDSVCNQFDNDPIFNCHIQNDGLLESHGLLRRSDIVTYNLRMPPASSYTDANGNQMGFEATVKDIVNGVYHFSLENSVSDYIGRIMNFEDEYTAVITGTTSSSLCAISNDGIGLFLRDDRDEKTPLSPGTIAKFRLLGGTHMGNITGSLIRISDNELDRFDKTSAFSKLMNGIGFKDEDDLVDDNFVADDNHEFLSTDTVREIIEIIRFKAIADTDLIKAFDYLRFCRLLALSIDDEALAVQLNTHARLLMLHQFYATNSRVDAESLEELRSLCHTDPLLSMIFHRLEMVSWLGHAEHNPELFKTVAEPKTELENSLARMVLSYNMMNNIDDKNDDTIATALKERIKEKLNVNSETKSGKYYGSESKYLEFKTSIVYPAGSPGAEVREDPAGQQAHIMSRIAGMLNASGGRLYIGVNNDGYAVGLHEDFRYFERHRAHIGKLNFEIKNVDNLCVFLENLIDRTFGSTIARKATEVAVDEDAGKDVVLITVKEYLEPVYIDGHLYVRQSGQSTREYHGKVLEEFIADRERQKIEQEHQAAMRRAELEANKALLAAEEDEAESRETVFEDTETPVETVQEVSLESDDNHIATSRWRPNVLHSYEDGFEEPIGYLYFMGENEIYFSVQDTYRDTDEDCRLALAIPHNMEDGYLILGFTHEHVLRITLSEIIERGDNESYRYTEDMPLLFASLAGKDDLLVNLVTDSGGTVWRRAIGITQIDRQHINSTPTLLYECNASATVGYEIADSSRRDQFAACMADRLTARRFGETMRCKYLDERYETNMEKLVELCQSTNN